MLNHITIMGRMTKDPELKYTSTEKAVVSFTVACERDYAPAGEKRETDFIDCVAWNKTAEFVARNFTKGSMVIVPGRLQIRDWTDRDGNKRRSAEIVAETVYFGEAKKKESDWTQAASTAPVLEDDGELPFL